MARLVVVGAGISGLAAAWAARHTAARAGVALDVIVLERGAGVGGKARTIVRDGWMVEGGPSGFLSGRPELDALIEAAGLTGQLLPARTAAKRRFIFRAGRMRELKVSPVGLAASGLLGAGGLLRLAAEPFVARATSGVDESVWAFAARRLGVQAADRLVSPATLGVFAGDAKRLSMTSAFPKMAALEREHGSLVRGMIARRRGARARLTSLRDGMQSLPRALAATGGFAVRCNADVRAIVRTPRGWSVAMEGDGTLLDADAIVIAAEPFAAAQLLRPLAPSAADALDAIPCPPVTVGALGYAAEAAAAIPDGFGVLVSRGE
ncbi:MAG: protoporphyrinogen oxidase, partial [Gemmatimonadaceae bacterium]